MHCVSLKLGVIFLFPSNGSSAATSEWLIEGRRLVPLLPRLVPQTVFTQTANQAAKEASEKNSQLMNPALTGNKECEWVLLCNKKRVWV